MSALVSLRDGLDGAVVLDAFAGSGALSLEALSRGADTAMLCERDGTPPPSSSATSPPCASAAIGRASCAATFSSVARQRPGVLSISSSSIRPTPPTRRRFSAS